MAGGEGFEPSTPNLGGWCSIREDIKTKREPLFAENSSIRTELLAHDIAKVNLAKQIPIDNLLKIEKVAIYLEEKGKQPNTIDSFRGCGPGVFLFGFPKVLNLCNQINLLVNSGRLDFKLPLYAASTRGHCWKRDASTDS